LHSDVNTWRHCFYIPTASTCPVHQLAPVSPNLETPRLIVKFFLKNVRLKLEFKDWSSSP
ncbi:MAG: hypothetical protein AB2693_17125, partial [Candidatus Thiodiazotropha sp.]